MDEAFPRRLLKDAPVPLRRPRRPDDQGPSGTNPANPVDVSRYVAEICGELTGMASSAKLTMLTYLLAMARHEAERIARTGSVGD